MGGKSLAAPWSLSVQDDHRSMCISLSFDKKFLLTLRCGPVRNAQVNRVFLDGGWVMNDGRDLGETPGQI
jgi:hypothetical protein